MTWPTRIIALLVAGLLASTAQAGSSLNVVLTVVLSSGPCAASVGTEAVSVSCGLASLPALPAVASLARTGGAAQQAFLGGSSGTSSPPFISISSGGSSVGAATGVPTGVSPGSFPGFSPGSPDGAPADPARKDEPIAERFLQEVAGWDSQALDDQTTRRVGTLPGWATGRNAMAVYSNGANLSSWRVVSNDNAQLVELTISW